MGVSLSLVNFNELFQQAKNEPIIINDISETSEEDKAVFNRMIYTKYSSDLLSNMPSCECGEIVGKYNMGVLCTNCGTPVQSAMDQKLEPLVWMRSPNGVAPLINPIVWTMLNERFTKSGFEVVRWLCDTNYKPQVKVPAVMDSVHALMRTLDIARGYNNFYHHFDAILAGLFDLKEFRPAKRPGQPSPGWTGWVKDKLHQVAEKAGTLLEKAGLRHKHEEPLQALLRQQRDCVFSDHLPLPNRALLVIEENNLGTFADPIGTGAVDAIRTMVGIDSSLSSYNVRAKENRTIKSIAQLGEFWDQVARTTLAKKEGLLRKHIFGTRSHFCFRAVISSLTDAHDYDELHIPWGIGISLMRIHLMNKLLRRGYSPNQAVAFLNRHAKRYNAEIDELFQILINECPYKGLPVVFQRNPSLERGSAQAMYITKVKTDVNIPTVSLSILSVKGFNADFDGDQLNGTLSLDLLTAEQLRALAPHKSTFDLNSPRAVSRNLSMPPPVVATIANWMHYPYPEPPQPEKLARMMALEDA